MSEKDVLRTFPTAFAHRVGVLKYEIRRPRTRTDSPRTSPICCDVWVFSTAEAAWEDAKAKLHLQD
jgi:hypothetical protein